MATFTARVPFAGTIEVTFKAESGAKDSEVRDLAYEAAAETLHGVEWPYFDSADGTTGDFGTVEVFKALVQGNFFHGDCSEIEVTSEEDDDEDEA